MKWRRDRNSVGSAQSGVRGFFCVLASVAAIIAVLHAGPVRADDTKFEAAVLLYQQQKYDVAAPTLEDFLKTTPDDPHAAEAEFLLGECYYQLVNPNKPEEAKLKRAAATLQNFLQRNEDPKHRPDAAIDLGNARYQLNQFQDAADAYGKVLNEAKDAKRLAYANYWLGQCLIETPPDYPGALKAYSTVVEKYPDSDQFKDALIQKGICQAAIGQDKKDPQFSRDAAVTFAEFLKKYPHDDSSTEVSYRMGDALYASSQYADAETAYKAVVADPKAGDFLTDATEGLAWTELKLTHTAEAARLFEAVAGKTKDRRRSDALFQSGAAYVLAGDLAHARTVFDPLLADPQDPHSPDAAYCLGAAYYKRAGLDKTGENKSLYKSASELLGAFVKARASDPRAGSVFVALGDSSLKLDDYAGAASAYSKALERMSPTDKKETRLAVLHGLLWADQKLKRDGDAAIVKARIQKEFPDSELAGQLGLSQTDQAFATGDFATASAAYQAFARNHPDDKDAPRALYRAGLALLKLGGRMADAAALFEDLVVRHPTSEFAAEGLWALGNADMEAKQYPDAIRAYSRILTQFPTVEDAAQSAIYGRAVARLKLEKPDQEGAYGDFSLFVQKYPTAKDAPEAAYWRLWIHNKQRLTIEQTLDAANGNGTGAQKPPGSAVTSPASHPTPGATMTPETMKLTKLAEAAVGDAGEALRAYPQGPRVVAEYMFLAENLVVLKRVPEAVDAWENAVKADPKAATAPQSLWDEGLAMQDLPARKTDAMTTFQRIVDDYADSPEAEKAMVQLAQMKMDAKDVDGAMKLFNAFLAKYPTDSLAATVAYADARVCYDKKDFAAAGPLFKTALSATASLTEKDAEYRLSEKFQQDARFYGAEAFRQANAPQDAIVMYKAYLDASPKGDHAAAALIGQGMSQQALGLNDDALSCYSRAIETDPADAGAAYCHKGEILITQKKYTDAVAAFTIVKVKYRDPDLDSLADFGSGQAEEGLELWADARASYEAVIKSRPTGDLAEKAKARVEAIKVAHP